METNVNCSVWIQDYHLHVCTFVLYIMYVHVVLVCSMLHKCAVKMMCISPPPHMI